jgi:hypothetical protein
VFDAKKVELAELKARFERELEVHSPDAGRLGRAYLAALAEFFEKRRITVRLQIPSGLHSIRRGW